MMSIFFRFLPLQILFWLCDRGKTVFCRGLIVRKINLFAIASLCVLSACGSDGLSPAATESSRVSSSGVGRAEKPVPALTLSREELDSAMQCSEGFGRKSGRAVLLVPGATQTVDSNFSWNFIPAFDQAGIPWCAVDLPFSNTGELQNSSEYITHAIRTMFKTTKTKIAVVGFSQGGVMPRWTLKYFPDTRDMVEDMIGIAAANHGLIETNLACATPVIGCITSFTQIAVDANWIDSLNEDGETFAGIDYTQVYTRTDEVAVPNFDEANGVSSLRTGDGNRVNIATQDICPTNTADHFLVGSSDPVSFAIVSDALANPGVASLERVKALAPELCVTPFMPGVEPSMFPINFATKMMSTFAQSVALQPKSTEEPPLRCYAGGEC